MSQEKNIFKMAETISNFVALVGKQLPDDVQERLKELRAQETSQPCKNNI